MATYEAPPSQHRQVFINFRGVDLRDGFVPHLLRGLKTDGVNAYIDNDEKMGVEFETLSKRIDESRIALVIFSSKYTESRWCLEELVKIKERVEEGKLVAVPIFYKLNPSEVKGLEGDFGLNLWDEVKRTSQFDKLQEWKEALDFAIQKRGFVSTAYSNEVGFLNDIVKHVKNCLHMQQTEDSHFQLSEKQNDAFVDTPFSRSEELKSVGGETVDTLLDVKSDVNPEEAESAESEATSYGKSRRDDDLNLTKDDSFLGEANSDATSDTQNSVEDKRVDPVDEETKQGKVGKSSMLVTYDAHPPQHQVFINYRGDELRNNFVSHLLMALKENGVNVFIDNDESRGPDIGNLFKRIDESSTALVIFSSRYTESRWCLDELVRIKERMDKGKLLVIPIFYKVKPSEVAKLKGDVGVKFWNLWRVNRDRHLIKWKEALKSVTSITGIYLNEHGSESEFITLTVNLVLESISRLEGERKPSFFPYTEKGKNTGLPTRKRENYETYLDKDHFFGMEQRMEQLEMMLEFDRNKTRIVGVVGLPGIGKTTLAKMLYEKWNCKFIRCVPLLDIRMKSKEYGLVWLRKTLLEVLLEGKIPVISDETTHESVKVELLRTKIFAVLDDVSDKKQLDYLLGDLDWIKKGSKIVITTRDRSLLEGFPHCTYEVPRLSGKDSVELFRHHAFDGQICSPTETFATLSNRFVDYARGNPLALNILGRELRGTDESYWKHKLQRMTKSPDAKIQDVLRFSIDELDVLQKDVFLDIACFFKSEDEYFVRSLLDSGDSDSTDAVSEVRDLANKFLITISDGRVEMHDLLYTLGKELGSSERHRLCNYKDITHKLTEMEKSEADNVRGLFLDMSTVTKNIALKPMTFTNMLHLRYLKIYDSCCPRQCKADCILHFHNGLEFPLQELRYLHWLKFPLNELPPDFRPENLVDLRLPYSQIVRVWEGVKDTPRLKWVDLGHSSKLLDLAALSKAENLQSLNLEGCTVLDALPVEIQNMKSLVFLNLRGCIRLSYLPEINLISLKTLILSGCAKLEEFNLISESLVLLHLDGTAIKGLPPSIKKLHRLILLNLKNCTMLSCLPTCLRELKALEELILSGCSSLNNLSGVRESMKHIQILHIDRIGAKEMPNISCVAKSEDQPFADMFVEPIGPSKWPLGVSGVSSLRHLCLNGNDFVSLQNDIGQLYNLTWLDVKQCKKLRSIPTLPPRLQYFDAHGCDSLERVANPLASPVMSEQIHATFNFSNCNKLDEDAKDSIISYTRRRSQLVVNELIRCSGGFVLESVIGTCFPGWEVPVWFSQQASGSVLETKLPPHWCDNQFTGIALSAVILFPGYHEQRNRLLVKCNCVFNDEDGSPIRFSCTIGSLSQPSNTPGKIEPHVFIGYTSMLDIKKHGEEEQEEGCSFTEALLEFQVTDGQEELEGCEVLKCGFSLVYATDERETIRWDAKTVVIPERIENFPGEVRSYENSGSHDDIQYETFFSEATFDATPNLQKNLENKSVDLVSEESDAGGSITSSSYHDNTSSVYSEKLQMDSLVGVELRLEQMEMREVWRFSIDNLNKRQKDVFLDIVHFFKSEDESFVRRILDSENPEAVSEVRDLVDKSLITISGGRVEMHDQLYKLSKELGSLGRHRLWNYKDIINKLTKMKQGEANNLRGIFVDMSEVKESIAMECMTFSDMRNLLYLMIYDSCCPRQCKADCNLYFPDGLEFPLEQLRYLHWVKFPLEELPPDFRPENLVDLRLPYSKIKRVWEGVKDTPRLKWVDLSHSSNFLDLSALSKAENLERLNLEGCTSLEELPVEIQNMKSLVFINLRGCTCLRSLSMMNLVSLKTLILSDCSNLKEFQLISESVEFLHLDGTAIKRLPPGIENLQRLVVLNLKNCKMLEGLPNCLGKLKVLDELILSGCSRLKNLPDVRHSLKHLQILLFDGTGAKELPSISCFAGSEGSTSADMVLQPFGSHCSMRERPCDVNGVYLLRRVCLSGSDFVTLQPDIGELYNLKWLDMKDCKKLRSVPTLPPRLQYFDAHGCDSLEKVANPLAFPVMSEHHATFNFSNCNKLDQDAKDNIMSYARKKSQIVLDKLTRCNGGLVLETLIGTCFPGSEVPAWFSHQAFGSVLKPKLPPHWCDNSFIGIGLCAVIAFSTYDYQRKHVIVKCKCQFKNEDESVIGFSCTVGGWREPSNTPRKIESDHVFIGFTSRLDMNIIGEEDNEEKCIFTETSISFQVTDGTEEIKDCEVIKCGFSLVYAPDERGNICSDS